MALTSVLSRDPAAEPSTEEEGPLDDPSFPSTLPNPTPPTATSTSTSTTALTLYLALVDAERFSSDFPLPITVFAGIKPFEAAVGRRGGGQGGWVWKTSDEWGYHADAEYWRE